MAKTMKWDGKTVPRELRDLPPGEYIVESLSEGAPLSPEDEAAIEQALESIRAGRIVEAEEARRRIDSALDR